MPKDIMILDTNTICVRGINIICKMISRARLDIGDIKLCVKEYTCREISEYEFIEPYVDVVFDFKEVDDSIKAESEMIVHVKKSSEYLDEPDMFYEIRIKLQIFYKLSRKYIDSTISDIQQDVIVKYMKNFMYTYMLLYIEDSGLYYLVGKITFPCSINVDEDDKVINLSNIQLD